MNKRDEQSLFKKLEKIFGFSKNEQIFIPKELAQEIVTETKTTIKTEKRGRKPKVTDTPSISSINNTLTKTNLFDLDDISDIDPKLKLDIKVVKEDEKGFASRVFNLFDIARQNGIKQLNTDQLTCAYYKVYSANNKDVIRTKRQISNKLYYLDFSKKKNVHNAYVVKVKDTLCTYTMSDCK